MELTENPGYAKELKKNRLLPEYAEEAFTPEFLDQDRCREWLLKQIHKDGVSCPECGNTIKDDKRCARFWGGKRLSCPECGKKFTALTGTLLSGSSLNFKEILFLMLALGSGARTSDTARRIGCDPKTVTNWRNKFLEL